MRKTPDVCLCSIAKPEVLVVRVGATDAPGNVSRDEGRSATGDASRDVLGDDFDNEDPIARRSAAKCLCSIAKPEVLVVGVSATDAPGNVARDEGRSDAGDASRAVLGADSDNEDPIA